MVETYESLFRRFISLFYLAHGNLYILLKGKCHKRIEEWKDRRVKAVEIKIILKSIF